MARKPLTPDQAAEVARNHTGRHDPVGLVSDDDGRRNSWSMWRLVVVVAIAVGFMLLAIVFLFAVSRNAPPAPHPTGGPYEQRFPSIRLGLAVSMSIVAAWLWIRYTRVADMPVTDVAAARPGNWLYSGELVGSDTHAALFSSTPSISSETIVQGNVVGRSHARTLHLSDASGSIRVNPEAICRSPAVYAVGAHQRSIVERVVRQNEPVTIFGFCGIDDHGELMLGLVPDNAPRSQRSWFGVLGDGRLALVTARTGALLLALGAALAWMSVFVMETWMGVRSDTGNSLSAVVIPRDVRRLALIGALVMVAIGAAGWLIGSVNRLISLRNQVRYADSVLDVATLQRDVTLHQMRQVVDVAEQHERSMLDLAATESAAAVRAEATPQIVAGTATQRMTTELVRCNDRIAAARRFHNDAVELARTRTSTFPRVLLRPLVFSSGLPELLVDDSESGATSGG